MQLSPDNGVTPAPRYSGDVPAMRAAYEHGIYFDGEIDIPILDVRYEDVVQVFRDHATFSSDSMASLMLELNPQEQEHFSLLIKYFSKWLVFTDPPYNVRIEGHVSGLGQVKHREFAMASGEMSGLPDQMSRVCCS